MPSRKIAEIRILPPLAIARLGSSPYPLVNYELITPPDTAPRRIEPALTIRVNRSTGEAELRMPKTPVQFRDPAGRIRPVAPFFEIWVRFEREFNLEPLTTQILSKLGLTPAAVRWRAQVENHKIFRHTGDKDDQIKAGTRFFSNHKVQLLCGECRNFIKDKSISLGSLQYIVPSATLPEIRLRFTPAAGYVYGPPAPDGNPTPFIREAVYDGERGGWQKYKESISTSQPDHKELFSTNPPQIFAGQTIITPDGSNSTLQSWGFFDDECDGIIEAELKIGKERPLTSFARIVAGPPTFAPDSLPVRTVADELEQAMFGPEAGETNLAEVAEIVRRALETVRLMNTAQMNQGSSQRGAGMARMDFLDVKRALEPIFDPAVADSTAIRARHERILLALEGGSLSWFARMLRKYDEVGDLSTLGRRKMPGLMRGADGRHLALTRRQASKIRQAAELPVADKGSH